MNNKEKWIDDVLSGLDGMEHRAQPDPAFVKNLEARLLQKPRITNLSSSTIWAVAASFLVLLSLNIAIPSIQQQKQRIVQTDGYEQLMDDYNLIPADDLTFTDYE